jgi:excinuclease ABC subunit B
MRLALDETNRRRDRQVAHNEANGITPRTVSKRVKEMIDGIYSDKGAKDDLKAARDALAGEVLSEKDLSKRIKLLERQMLEHAKNLEFEKAARVRDQLAALREQAFGAAVHDSVLPIQAGLPGRPGAVPPGAPLKRN